MNHSSYSVLTIGGNIPEKKFKNFCVKKLGYNPLDTQETSSMESNINSDGYLVIIDSCARYGMFEELEKWLVDNNIPFNRQNDSCPGEYGPIFKWWRPGMKEPIETAFDEDLYELTVPLAEVRSRLGDINELRRWLDKHYPKPTQLPPAVLVQE